MHTHPLQHLILSLLMFFGVAGTAIAAAAAGVFGLKACLAGVALLLSAMLVDGAV